MMDGRMLLRRPVLSNFNAVYESGPRKVKNSTEIAAELYTAVQLAPFLRRNWFRRFHTVIIAYDACLSGGAVVYANATENMAERYAHLKRAYDARFGWEQRGSEISYCVCCGALFARQEGGRALSCAASEVLGPRSSGSHPHRVPRAENRAAPQARAL